MWAVEWILVACLAGAVCAHGARLARNERVRADDARPLADDELRSARDTRPARDGADADSADDPPSYAEVTSAERVSV